MGILTVIFTALALAMDAFSISVSKGLCCKKPLVSDGIRIAFVFGGFQALMPLIGWAVGSRFYSLIDRFSHWIAFGLLAFIGLKMIYESVCKKNEPEDLCNIGMQWKVLVILGIATSIDALAVGLSFAMLIDNFGVLLFDCLVIGVITFVLTFIGYFLGQKFSRFLGNKAEIIGGLVLLIIGIKIVLEKVL